MKLLSNDRNESSLKFGNCRFNSLSVNFVGVTRIWTIKETLLTWILDAERVYTASQKNSTLDVSMFLKSKCELIFKNLLVKEL